MAVEAMNLGHNQAATYIIIELAWEGEIYLPAGTHGRGLTHSQLRGPGAKYVYSLREGQG